MNILFRRRSEECLAFFSIKEIASFFWNIVRFFSLLLHRPGAARRTVEGGMVKIYFLWNCNSWTIPASSSRLVPARRTVEGGTVFLYSRMAERWIPSVVLPLLTILLDPTYPAENRRRFRHRRRCYPNPSSRWVPSSKRKRNIPVECSGCCRYHPIETGEISDQQSSSDNRTWNEKGAREKSGDII